MDDVLNKEKTDVKNINEQQKAHRKDSIELLRIISMALIVMGHMVHQSDILFPAEIFTRNHIFAILVGSGASMSVNVFLMISCWFLIGKEFKLVRILRTWLETLFYTLTITVLCKIFKIAEVGGGAIIRGFITYNVTDNFGMLLYI